MQRLIVKEPNIRMFFHNCNTELISTSEDGYIEDLIVQINSLNCGDLNIAPLGYGTTKMSFLWNSYIDPLRLRGFIRLSHKSKKHSVVFDFKEGQGCIKSLVLTREKTTGPFKRAKVFFRTADLSKKIVPDLFLIRFILEECNVNYEHELLTLFISHGYLLPAAIANTYDTTLGLGLKDINKDTKLQKSIRSYIQIAKDFDLKNHNRTMGGFFKLVEYKYRELNGITVQPVRYDECKVKMEAIFNGS